MIGISIWDVDMECRTSTGYRYGIWWIDMAIHIIDLVYRYGHSPYRFGHLGYRYGDQIDMGYLVTLATCPALPASLTSSSLSAITSSRTLSTNSAMSSAARRPVQWVHEGVPIHVHGKCGSHGNVPVHVDMMRQDSGFKWTGVSPWYDSNWSWVVSATAALAMATCAASWEGHRFSAIALPMSEHGFAPVCHGSHGGSLVPPHTR